MDFIVNDIKIFVLGADSDSKAQQTTHFEGDSFINENKNYFI